MGPGSIAFTGNAPSFTNFVALEAIAAGTEIHFTNNYVSVGDTSGSIWTWTASEDIAAGTVVTLENWLPANVGDPVSATSNHGTVAYQGPDVPSISGMWLIAYTGEASSATYLTAIVSSGSSDASIYLTGTGLTFGVNAVSLAYNPQGTAIIGAYTGPTSGFATFEDYQAALFNAANWAQQAFSVGDPRYDGVGPDLPFSTTPFTNDPAVQTVGFETLFVSVTEGDESESQTLTFTISRTGGTVGDLTFSGSIVLGSGVDAADFGGSLPTFSGVIPDGADSVAVTIQVVGDIKYEADETFQIELDNVSNASSAANVGGAGTATVTIVNNDAPQTVGFAAESQSFSIAEGNDGTQALTFTVERTEGGTLGDVSFQIEFLFSGGNINADDFGGTLPTFFDGIIPAGQSRATFSIPVSGDLRVENNESFALRIISANNDPVGAVIGGNSVSIVTVVNDDAASLTIGAGTVSEGTITLTGADHLTVEAGGLIQTRSSAAVTWSGAASSATIDNYGTMEEVTGSANIITVASSARGALLINNHEGAVIETTVDLSGQRSGTTVTVENEGLINGVLSNAFRLSTTSGAATVINNRATGVITSDHAGVDVIKNARDATINNWGQIVSAADTLSMSNGYAINVGSNVGNVIHNYDGGLIEGSRSAITGKRGITVVNEEGGTIIGRNGSAVNWDNDASSSNAAHITNYGLMEARSTNSTDSDGDAIDVDGLVYLDNYGTVRGLGHNGYHDGEPNVSEGIAAGGGVINNYAGGMIYGYGRAIQMDDSGNAGAFAATTIVNDGTIKGDANLPTGVTPEEVALFAERFRGGEAVNIVGNQADSLTNTGEIIGGVKMDDGDDTVINEGTITATGGSAVNLGEGNDTFEAHTGSTVAGLIDGGEGNDVLNLAGTGEGAIGDIAGIETINLVGGSWTLGDEGAAVVFKDGTQTLAVESSVLADGNFAGVISGASIGDAIDLKGIGLATGVTLGAGNLLTITGGTNGPVTLQLDPSQDFSHFNLALADDGAGGTTITLEQKPMGPGSIAFTGYNADGGDNLSFVVLENIAAGTVIHFTDNEWTGSAFNTGESIWNWTATSDITAGTVVTMDGLAAGQTATSNLGTIAFSNETQRDIGNANETVYAYVGEASAPGFVAAISNDNFTSANGLLTNTGLVQGQTALSLTSLDADADIAVYAGVRGASSFGALLPMINNPANWISQDTALSDENDGAPPDLPLPTSPFVGEPGFQTIGFTGPLTMTQAEGDSGVIVFTFTVERSGGTVGAIAFSGTIGGTTNDADFGGTKPLTFSGVIADGATSATVTITVSGDTMLETTETAVLTLTTAHNDDVTTVLGSSQTRTAIITDEDPYVVVGGQVFTGALTVPAGEALTVEQGGTIQGDVVLNNPSILPSLTNSGEIISAGQAVVAGTSTAQDFTGGITIVNNAGGLIEGTTRAVRVTADLHGSTFTLINEGTIRSLTTEVIRLDDAINGHFVVENRAGGLIRGESQQNDVLRVGNNTTIINAGTIENALDVPGAGRGGDGVDFKSGTGSSLHNLAGGHIEASRHAVTGERGVSVVNDAGGVIVGRNGSAVNIDNDATVANTVHVANYGLMQGKSANYEDSDGDAVDVDGLAEISNWGTIEGLGHNGYHDGEPNISEAIAMGGGTITNYAGAKLYGYGRAIQIDNSSNAGAFAATTITNGGLIQGDGHLPTAVTPEDVALFAERIRGGEAINIVGTFGDTVTNTATGRIIGGVRMGGGDDIIVNKGMMTATGGSAVDLGVGNDTFEYHVGSAVTGLIDGGAGDDTLKLIGAGFGSVGANANFEKLDVQSGMWSIQSDAYDVVNVATGATVTSQLKLADQGEMTVAMGGIVLVTNGSDAVVTEGSADIENAGLIQGLGMQGAAMAKAIVTNGGTVHNKAGGTILAMGTAIASGAAPAAGVDIVNEGMIQSMMGQAIVLGGQDDSVTNKGMIAGSVDLGAGDDMLSIHTGSSISGAITGGEGDDTVRLVGTTPSTVGSFNSATVSSFEKLAVAEGTWSVADQVHAFANIVIEDGATVTSGILLENTDTLKIEHGGKLIMPASYVNSASSPTDVTAIDNAGVISVVYERPESYGPAVVLDMSSPGSKVTLWNREGGMIESNEVAILVTGRGGGSVEINNAGLISDAGSPPAIHARNFFGDELVLNNFETGVIRGKVDGQFDVVNNAGQMEGGFQYANKPVTFNNLAGGHIEGAGHAVTGKASITVNNAAGATMVGLNGSAVNIDNRPGAENTVYVRNYGTMEGRSAELSDSDGDAIDTDGLAQILNYGRIAGLGHQGYHDGDANISEGIAIGGGTIVNNAGGEIYGYGRAIQVDDSENGPAFAATTIVNDGLIQGDGHGPEGVNPEDAASVDLRGNEAINLVGDYEDFVGNNASGRIVGGISMGGGRDTLNNSGSIRATGGSAINMGAGNDQVNLYVGATVVGAILLGLGDDVALSTSSAGFTIDGGEGNDSIFMDSNYSGDDDLKGGAGDDYVYGGAGNDQIDGGDGNDTLKGENGNDVIDGGAGDDIILAGAGDTIKGGAGDDVVEVSKWDGIPGSIDGGEGNDTLKLTGDTTASSFNSSGVTNVENLVVTEGTWSLTGGDYSSFTIENGATVTSALTLNSNDHLTIDAGGKLSGAISHSGNGNVVVDNSGLIQVSGRVLNGSSTGTLILNNLAGATIKQIGSDTDVIRPGQNATVNNWGTITTGDGFVGSGDLIDFQSSTGGKVNNYAGGWMEGSRHAVTGDNAVTVVNEGTMIGRNGSAVNIDNGGSEEETVRVTNRGVMEGRSATLSDSDGDAVDVDGLLYLLNYGRIAGMGANGRHDGEPNVSEGIAIGGGTILNYGANAEIYGYGRAIQVDNSSNSNALGKTFINNEGLIKGDGHGPEGVTYQSPEEAAKFDLRGNEAINLVGDYDDEILNQSTGRIVGGVSMGGGNDHLQSLGSFVATGGSAIDMGAGNDTVYFYTGTTVQGSVLLGTGDDLLLSTAGGGFVIDAGDGNDQIYLDSNFSGNDVLSGGAGDDHLYAGSGNDQINGDDGNDILSGENGDDVVDGGAGDDQIMGGNGADTLRGGEGNDTIKAGTGDIVEGGAGDDVVEVSTWDGTPSSIDGGEDDDTVKLAGPGTGSLGATTNVENLLVQEGSWSVAASDYSSITIKTGAMVTSTLTLNNDDTLTIENGGRLTTGTAINWAGGGDVVIDNAGRIEASSRVLNTTAGATGSLTFNNDGTVVGALTPQGAGHADAVITLNNSGIIESAVNGRVIDFRNFDANGASAIINNLAGGIIRKIGGDDADVIRPGVDGVVNNWGTITVDVAGVDAIDFQSDAGGKVNNYAGGLIQGTKHAVTGEKSVTVVNSGTMVGLNGSAVNIDNDGTEAEKVFVTNRGIMEGRSNESADSDGDAIDVDGLLQLDNYGRIAGLGAEGYHDGEPNVSEGIAVGGGTIINYVTGEIYGYGRGIQVDNSSNENALGDTLIVNDGLIQGDGHGPEGVDPADAAQFDLRGNEAINLVGDYGDLIVNTRTGRIIGGVSTGGGNDLMTNQGSIVATGGSAINMGAGNDTLSLHDGSVVVGTILLGTGNDVMSSSTSVDLVIEGGDGQDSIGLAGGDDIVSGGAGIDLIHAGAGEDRIDGGLDNDQLRGGDGDDLIEGGAGDDYIDGGNDDDVIYGDDGHDTILGGLGNDTIKGNAGDDIFVITATADGRDSYDGGEGVDTLDYSAVSTAVNLTLKDDAASTFSTDTIENVENVIGGSANDKLTGNSLDNVLTGNAGDDTLKGMAGNDTLDGGAGIDNLDGGVGNDQLSGGLNDDVLKGAAGDDSLEGGDGNDDLDGGADNDTLLGGAGNDILKGGAGNDTITGDAGNDTLTGGAGNDRFVFSGLSDGIDTITDFKTSGASEDQLVLSSSMFQNFGGDDAFDLIGSGFLRALSSNGTTQIQIDVDGGGDSFVTLATLTGNMSNGALADHVLVHQDPIA